jgi:hypothetical protein
MWRNGRGNGRLKGNRRERKKGKCVAKGRYIRKQTQRNEGKGKQGEEDKLVKSMKKS